MEMDRMLGGSRGEGSSMHLRSIGSDDEEDAAAGDVRADATAASARENDQDLATGERLTRVDLTQHDPVLEAEEEGNDDGEDDKEDDDEEDKDEEDHASGEHAEEPLQGGSGKPKKSREGERHVSVEEMALALAQEEALVNDTLDPHHALAFTEEIHEVDVVSQLLADGLTAQIQSAVEETAFGLPHLDVQDPGEARRSSLQMITTAAREFKDMHRASSQDVNDPEAVTLVKARKLWWREAWRTIGYTLVFLDALYVLVSAPFRMGYFYDPWNHPKKHDEWTEALTLFTVCDILGEVTRLGFAWRTGSTNAVMASVSSTKSVATTKTTTRNTLHLEDGGDTKKNSVFIRPTRKSLFSTRGSVTSGGISVKTTEALSSVTQTSEVGRHSIPTVALVLGAFPIEAVVAIFSYNLLHIVRMAKLVIVGYSLAPSYTVLLLKCRRFRWAQWLSFSTLATPFYLFWLGLYLCHLSACGYMLIANIECGLKSQYCVKTPIPGSWVLKDNMEQATLWRQYVRSMYWASKTVTTLGQGDLVPATQMETNYCVVVQFISGLWATAFLASCSFYFSRRDRDIENGVSTRLEQALRSRKVPSTLAHQIRNYYQHIQRTRNGIDEDQVLLSLPAHYRSQCGFFVKYRLLAKIPFFSKQPKAFLRGVVEHIENDFLSPKQTILALFEVVELIIVARGEINVLDQSKILVKVVGKEEWYGEEALYDETRSKHELESTSFCEVLRLSREHFQACMEKHFPRLKIAAMVAQQKRRVAMIPSTDIRLQPVAADVVSNMQRRASGRSTILTFITQTFSNGSDDIPWNYPNSAFRKRWRRIKAVLLIFLAIEVPFEVAFVWRIGFFGVDATTSQRLVYLSSVLVEVFFYVDWYFRVFVFARTSGSIALKREESVRDVTQRSMREDLVMAAATAKARDGIVTKSHDLMRLYLLQNGLWFDIIVNIPIAIAWNFINQPSFSVLVREFMRCARLLAFGRLFVLKPMLKKIMVEHDLSPASRLLANVVVFCVITANAMACYFYLLADDKDFYDALPVGFDPDLTPVSSLQCLEQATLYGNCTWFVYDRSTFFIKARYIRSLHWSLVLLSTVGYGDILSFTNSECLIGFWWIYLGALICYFTSCAVGSVISQVTVLRSAQDSRVEAITRALVETNISRPMRVMIRSHYEANWELNGSVLPEQNLMEHLPRSLRHQLSSSLYVQDIRKCFVFSSLGGQATMLREIALLMSSEIFLPGVIIVEHGHLASTLYVIQSGDVELLLPFDSNQRTSSTARRRSMLESQKMLSNPLRRLYYTLVYKFRQHRQQVQASAHPSSAQVTTKRSLGFPVSALKDGDCFGEEGLLPDNRTALRLSARTLTGTQVATLTRDAFMNLAGKFPVQVRQIVTLIARKQESESTLFETIRGNFRQHPKALEFMGMTASLYCETKVAVNNIITPNQYRYRIWRIVHGLIIVYNFYSITFRLAFLPNPSADTMLALTVVDYLTDAFLYADIYLKWNRFGYEEYGDNIVNIVAIRRRYKKGWLQNDCWSMLPTYYYGDPFYMTVARLPRFLKSLQLFENISALEGVIREKFMKGSTTMLSVFDLFKFLIYFLSAAHHIGSTYFLLGRLLTENGLAKASWMTVDPIINAYPGQILVQYNRAIYWCLETFTVVCFGDVLARNSAETLYASLTCIIGWMCIGQVVGRITSLMANIDKDKSDHNARVESFEKFAHENGLPQYLKERAVESVEYKSKCMIELNLRTTFEDLPPALHAMLFEEMYGSIVRHIPEFTHVMKAPQLRVLADALTLHIYVTDDVIFEEGRLGTSLYVMKEGRAELFSARSLLVFTAVYEGQIFGEMAFFIPGTRHMTSARASRSCQVLQIDRRTWNALWDENTRHTLEEKAAAMARQKLASVTLAHGNIATNLHSSNEASASLPQRQMEPQATVANVLRKLSHGNLPGATQLRSSVRGYISLWAAVKSLLWVRVSGKVAPVSAYTPRRRSSKKKDTFTGPKSHKLQRCLGINYKSALPLVATPQVLPEVIPEGNVGGNHASAYAHHLETIKTRFQQRQDRSMFNLHQLTATTPSTGDVGSTTSEIWVEPPLPPSFCLETSDFRRAWNAMNYFICLYYITIVPFRVSFDYEFLSAEDNQTVVLVWFLFEYVMDIMCIIDFVLNKNYFTFVNRGIVVTEKHAIRDNYLHKGTYLMDLFCIIPFELLLPFAPLKNAPGTNVKVTWYRVAVFRMNKVVRITHLHELGDRLQRTLVYDMKLPYVRSSLIYFIRFAFDFALGAHWVACMFYGASFNAIDENYPSWLKTAGMLTFEGRDTEYEVGKVAVEVKYARSYHFSMGAITTVSYGDIAPQNAWETFFGTFVIIISIVLFGMLSGGFSQVFEMEMGKRADYEEKIASVAHFMTFHQFPARIWKHMQSYFIVHWSESQGMNEEELLSGLPLSVKEDITLFVKQEFVKQMRLFQGCDEAFVRAVVASFDQELFVRNDVIITYGDRGRSLYVIESGNVLVRIPQSPVVAADTSSASRDRTSVSVAADVEVIKGRFEFFGEKSLIFDIPRSATCIALSSCSMLILSVEKYDAIIEQFPEYREKNMRDWIFTHPSGDKANRAIQAIRRMPNGSTTRSRQRGAKTHAPGLKQRVRFNVPKLRSGGPESPTAATILHSSPGSSGRARNHDAQAPAVAVSAQPRRRLIRRAVYPPASKPAPPPSQIQSPSLSDIDNSAPSIENAGDRTNQRQTIDERIDEMGCILTKVCSTDDDDDALLVDDLKQQQHRGSGLNLAMPKRLTRTATQLMLLDPLMASNQKKNNYPKVGRVDDHVYYGGGVPGVALDEASLASAVYTGAVDGGYTSASGRLRWGAHTRAGNDPLRRRKENQDCFCVADRLADEPNVTLFSVFDGHGPHGAHVSHLVRELYHDKIAAVYRELVLQSKSDASARATRRASVGNDIMGELFTRAAHSVAEQLTAMAAPASTMDISVSGTTAVAMLVCDRDVFVANVGDSRAVIAVYSEQAKKYVIRHESKDHKPELPEERQRIEANNGRVFEWGTYRVWLQDVDMPGLAMSRSLGDAIASGIGVTADPDVIYVDKVIQSDAQHRSFAVLASDGVWEFMTSDECVALVAKCLEDSRMTPQEACNALVAEALERWNREEDVVDDITAIVVCF